MKIIIVSCVIVAVVCLVVFVLSVRAIIRNAKNKNKVNKRIATSDLFYESKNVQYMAKVFKKKDSGAYIMKMQLVTYVGDDNHLMSVREPQSFYIGCMTLTVRDKNGTIYGSYLYDNTVKYGENEVREGMLDIKDIIKRQVVEFDIDLAPGAVKPDGSFDLLVDSHGSVMRFSVLFDEIVTGIPCKKEANTQ
ncbi:MAG: hypothetical protein IKB54_06605 [Clostridia bacterium]|nr:hypothetical protein [Clostridia bacterium]